MSTENAFLSTFLALGKLSRANRKVPIGHSEAPFGTLLGAFIHSIFYGDVGSTIGKLQRATEVFTWLIEAKSVICAGTTGLVEGVWKRQSPRSQLV